jgi:Xaa-Pro dipeptidase
VVTVEPGCYFIEPLLDKLRAGPAADAVRWQNVDQIRRFGGIRIEDEVALLDGGTTNLTRDNWPKHT